MSFTRYVAKWMSESTLTKFILIILVFGPLAYLLCRQLAIPVQLWGFASMIMGFFFGVVTTNHGKGA